MPYSKSTEGRVSSNVCCKKSVVTYSMSIFIMFSTQHILCIHNPFKKKVIFPFRGKPFFLKNYMLKLILRKRFVMTILISPFLLLSIYGLAICFVRGCLQLIVALVNPKLSRESHTCNISVTFSFIF